MTFNLLPISQIVSKRANFQYLYYESTTFEIQFSKFVSPWLSLCYVGVYMYCKKKWTCFYRYNSLHSSFPFYLQLQNVSFVWVTLPNCLIHLFNKRCPLLVLNKKYIFDNNTETVGW